MNRDKAYTAMKDKLEGIVKDGRTNTTRMLKRIEAEWSQRRDIIVRSNAMDFGLDLHGNFAIMAGGEHLTPTNHAYGQLLSRAHVPPRYAEELMKLGLNELLRTNLRTLLPVVSPGGILVRHVGPVAKGILSSSYKRMDASPVFQSYVEHSVKAGLVPYRSTVTDTRYTVSFLDQRIHRFGLHEFVVFGTELCTGDYGGVAAVYGLMALRIVCINLSVGFNVFRSIHLGRRFELSEDDSDIIEISRKTVEYDTKALVSAVGDAVNSTDRLLTQLAEKVEAANNSEPELKEILAKLKTKGFKKDVVDKVRETYESDALPYEVLPQERTAWRLSNAISFLARSAEGDDKHELERAAMSVLAA